MIHNSEVYASSASPEEFALKAAKIPTTEIPWENPLIPNKRLRELYTSMAELRLLDIHVADLQRRSKDRLNAVPAEEACRASTALSLLPGDVTSDPAPGVATRFLRRSKLSDVLLEANLPVSAMRLAPAELPVAIDSERRLLLAIGAALTLAAQKKGPLVLAYLYPDELGIEEWKPIFRLAAAHTAPIIFVALPDATAKPGKLSEISTKAGVPGIPVDAADAVALYRVVQESMVRVRAGGGPVLMECIPFKLPGKKSPPADPVLNMRASLIHRQIADDAWFDSVETRFAARLKAAAL